MQILTCSLLPLDHISLGLLEKQPSSAVFQHFLLGLGYGVECRGGSDLALLWLWCRPAAMASIRPLAWKPLCATGVPLKRQKTKKKKK